MKEVLEEDLDEIATWTAKAEAEVEVIVVTSAAPPNASILCELPRDLWVVPPSSNRGRAFLALAGTEGIQANVGLELAAAQGVSLAEEMSSPAAMAKASWAMRAARSLIR